MEPVRIEELKDLATYERMRPELRKRVIELRRDRRIAAGEKLSLVFENRETVLYQVQEMLRAERITANGAIQHELDTYNELLPRSDSLAGTLFIELAQSDRIREELEEFLGLDRGDHRGSISVGARGPWVGSPRAKARKGASPASVRSVSFTRTGPRPSGPSLPGLLRRRTPELPHSCSR
jgi:hypothetical protein